MEMEKGRICVTGGAGFVASWIIKRLLEDGYSVNTTVRSDDSGLKEDVSYLISLPQASDRLKIFEADLSKPESFVAPIKGCIGVFHVAHPMDFGSNDTVEGVTEKSIRGGLGVLQACVDSKTVKKVVYTSSMTTVMFSGKTDTKVLDEKSWSDVDYIRDHVKSMGAWYHISKTLTEKAIIEFGEKEGLDVVTIQPTFVHGPFLGPQCPKSVRSVMAMIFGDTHMYGMLWRAPFVHVDDVASAHIHLFEHLTAKGRYICSKTEVPIDELYKLLSTKYPEYNIPNIDLLNSGDVEKVIFPSVSSEKLFRTGFQFKYGIEEMFDHAIECCKQNNIL